jgi:hypothetical protein
MKPAFPCLLAFSLAGCASIYVQPSAGSATAMVSFSASGEPVLGYVAILSQRPAPEDHGCFLKLARMAVISKGNPLASTNNPPDIAIDAQSESGLRAAFIRAIIAFQHGCIYDLNFKPESGHAYLVSMGWESNSCKANVQEQVGGNWSDPPALTVTRIRC